MLLEVMQSPRAIAVLVLLLAAAGCASVDTGPVPVEDRSRSGDVTDIESGLPQPGPGPRVPGSDVPAGVPGQSPAITALLGEAEAALAGSDTDRAAAVLERALRIEAKNPLVWSRLAHVNYLQGKWQQTLTMARRSNSLAPRQYSLQLANWRLILLVKEKTRDQDGIDEARSRIDALSKLSGDSSS